jgi:tripartite-type tricarboxylate transporter receptor subunit TctC
LKRNNVFVMVLLGILIVTFGMTEQSLSAEKYPSKPIKIIVTKSVGGSVDTAVRLVGPFLEKELGVPVVVQNITSGGGRVGDEAVYTAEPDGYTLLATPLPSSIIGEVMYNGKTDFQKMTPVYNIMQTFQTVTVGYNSKFKSFKELLEYGKTNKVTLAGSGGMGSNASLVYAKLKSFGMKGITMVPFPGASETAAAVMGGHCDISSQSTDGVLQFVENKTLKVLAVCSPKRIGFLPKVPTFKELGFDFIVPLTSSVYGPPKMSNDKVKVLEKAFGKAMKNKQLLEMREKMNVALYPLTAGKLKTLTDDSTKLVNEMLPFLKEMEGK